MGLVDEIVGELDFLKPQPRGMVPVGALELLAEATKENPAA